MFRQKSKAPKTATTDTMDEQTLTLTVERLQTDGTISQEQSKLLHSALASDLQDAQYIIKNLGAHLAIGVVFAFDVIPLPLGTIGRVSWVAGARVLETFRRNWQRASIHSWKVLIIAAIPWFGYAAYLLPLRNQSQELTFVIANHSWLKRTGRSYEDFVGERSAPVKKFARWLVPLPVDFQ